MVQEKSSIKTCSIRVSEEALTARLAWQGRAQQYRKYIVSKVPLVCRRQAASLC